MSVNYTKRLLRVLDALHADPGADWSLDQLADIAALSRFHFHRVFGAMTGETVGDAVRRVRLHRASYALSRSDAPIAEIARAVGYGDEAAFSRAFRAHFGCSPGAFRQNPRNDPAAASALVDTEPLSMRSPMYPLTVSDQPDRRALCLAHRGPYDLISKTFEHLGPMAGGAGLWPHAQGMVGIYLDDPASVPPQDLRSFAGVLVPADLPCPEGFHDIALPGGRHAVLEFKGPYAGLQQAYGWLYGPWLAQSGERPADAPSWEFYVNMPHDTRPEDLMTHLHLPLQG